MTGHRSETVESSSVFLAHLLEVFFLLTHLQVFLAPFCSSNFQSSSRQASLSLLVVGLETGEEVGGFGVGFGPSSGTRVPVQLPRGKLVTPSIGSVVMVDMSKVGG